jgi:multiple sugar transport system permease protein
MLGEQTAATHEYSSGAPRAAASARESIRRVPGIAASGLVLMVVAVFVGFPILYMVLLSFKSRAQAFNTVFVFSPTLANFQYVLENSTFVHSIFNTLIISVLAVLVGLVVSVPCAYGLARLRFRGQESLAFTILSFRFAPALLIALPVYLIYQRLGLLDSYTGMVWIYQLITVPFIVWIMRSYFEDIPVDIEHAGYMDGYGRLRVFWKIMVPLVRPGLIASALLVFVFCWNAYTVPLVLAGSSTPMVTVESLNFLGGISVHYGAVAAAGLIAAVPEVVLALILQRYLVRGLSLGAVKA